MQKPKKRKMDFNKILNRAKKMEQLREEKTQNLEDLHIKLQKGNSKTGENCFTVSLIPIVDCGYKCKECSKDCYDIKNVCWQTSVMNDRARNSAIHKYDLDRYWKEIDTQIKARYITQLRLNVGGDVNYSDYAYIQKLGIENSKTDILFFTKDDTGIEKWLSEGNEFPQNIHAILSIWENTEMENPFKLPTAHVLYPDGRTTAKEYGAYYCSGNCSECHFNKKGCWQLKKGEQVIFSLH